MEKLTAEEIIERLGMKPLPIEGGYYAVNYRSEDTLTANALPARYNDDRIMGGAIYFLETPEQFSALHRLPTDEIYYHHYGDPLEMLFLYPDGTGETRVLGPNLFAGHHPQIVAPHGCIHGSRPMPDGEFGFAFLSTSMAPAHHPTDPFFPLRAEIVDAYPDFKDMIEALTRMEPINL